MLTWRDPRRRNIKSKDEVKDKLPVYIEANNAGDTGGPTTHLLFFRILAKMNF